MNLSQILTEILLEAAGIKTIRATGADAERHMNKYVSPYLKGGSMHSAEGTHTLDKDHGSLKAGTRVFLQHATKEEHTPPSVVVSKVGSKEKHVVPITKLQKPVKAVNRGLAGEADLTKHLNKVGLMHGGGAGSTAGNDFHLIDKRGASPKKIKGKDGTPQAAHTIEGEHKNSLKAAFGQLTLSRHPTTGKWHISDEARARRPEFASHIEKAKVGGISLLQHLNKTEGKVGTSNKSGFHSEHTDLSPAHAYMRDHHVDVAHIDSHGTFKAGLSEKTDRHGLGLPTMSGTGRFRVRQKTNDTEKRSVQFSVNKLNKSNINLRDEAGAAELKKRLGH